MKMKTKGTKELKRREKSHRVLAKSTKQLPDIYWYWYLTDEAVHETPTISSDISYPENFFTTVTNMGEEAYSYLANALNQNFSTIVYCHGNGREPSSYDIYYDLWDIGDGFNDKGSINNNDGYFSLSYLQSLMKADGLQNCGYKYRDIRKGQAYPSQFQWKHMNADDYKTLITDKNIEELVEQCGKERLNKMNTGTAIALLDSGKHSLDDIVSLTKLKRWEIYKEIYGRFLRMEHTMIK